MTEESELGILENPLLIEHKNFLVIWGFMVLINFFGIAIWEFPEMGFIVVAIATLIQVVFYKILWDMLNIVWNKLTAYLRSGKCIIWNKIIAHLLNERCVFCGRGNCGNFAKRGIEYDY